MPLFRSRRRRSPLGKRRRRRRVVLLVVFLLFLIGCSAGAVFGLRHEKVQITDITITGGERISHEEIRTAIRTELAGSYFYLIPRRSIFVYPQEEIRARIHNTFSRVSRVVFDRDFFSALTVHIYEHEPYALWCTGVPNAARGQVAPGMATTSRDIVNHNSSEEQPCYYITRNGFIFNKAPVFSDDIYFRYYGGDIVSDPMRTFMLPRTQFTDVRLFMERLRDLGVRPSSLTVRSSGSAVIALEGGGRIVFEQDASMQTLLQNIANVLRSTDIDLAPISKTRDTIDYIDLRYDGKVYYKMRATSTE